MNTMVSFGAVLVAVLVAFALTYPDGSTAAGVTAIVAVAVVVPLAFYPTSKTLWSAIDLAMRPLEPEDDVDPRYIPGSRHRRPDRSRAEAGGGAPSQRPTRRACQPGGRGR